MNPDTIAKKRSPLPSWLPWIAIPIIFIVSYALFTMAWQARADRIGEALCTSYFQPIEGVEGEEQIECGGLNHLSLVVQSEDTGWHTREIVFTGALGIATTMSRMEEGSANQTESAAESETADPLGSQAVRCKALKLASFSFHPLRFGYTQNASYDSIARVIEACTQSRASDTERPLQLCTGTRSPLPPQICNPSLQFASQMQEFDQGAGAWIVTALVLVAIIFGLFQLVTLVLAIWGLSAAIRLSATVQGRSKQGPTPNESIEQWTDLARFPAMVAATATLKATQKVSEEKREQTYNALRDTYIDAVDRKFRRVEVFGDLVVLLGLLGTLYGMLTLFAALAETGSADPLTAELASSRMLGSLGLAFGTTIFAAGLRFLLLLAVPLLRDPAEIEAKNIYIEAFQGLELPEVSKPQTSSKVARDDEVLPGFDDILPELDSWGWRAGLGNARGSGNRFPLWTIAFAIVLGTLLFLFTGLIADIQALRTNQ